MNHHLKRVVDRLGTGVIEFLRERQASKVHDGKFYAEDLRRHLETLFPEGFAPASATRTLQRLRQEGVISYKCLNRRASLYEVHWLHDNTAEGA